MCAFQERVKKKTGGKWIEQRKEKHEKIMRQYWYDKSCDIRQTMK